jgi:hypothetical protein
VTIGDLIRDGKLLEVSCSSCRPARHLYIDVSSLDPSEAAAGAGGGQPSRLLQVRRQEYRDLYPDQGETDARVGPLGHYPDYSKGKR